MAGRSKLSDQQEALAQKKIPAAGYVIWWHIEGAHERRFVDAQAQAQGIKELRKRPRASFTNALNEIQKDNPRLVTKKIQDDVTILTYAIAEVETKAASKTLEWGEQSWVAFDKETADIFWKEKDTRVEAFISRYEWYQDHYTNGDVRGMVEREVKKTQAISLRTTGGVYFVAPANMVRVESLNRFLDGLPGSSHISILMVPEADVLGQTSIQRDFEIQANGTLDALLKRCDETLNFTSAKRAVTELVELERDCDGMEAVLNFKGSALKKRAEKVRKAISKALVMDA